MCTAFAHWAARNANAMVQPIASAESALLAAGVPREEHFSAAYAMSGRRLERGSQAVAALLMASRLTWVRLAGKLLAVPVWRGLADAVYAWVANNRSGISRWIMRPRP